jgi:cytochrome P450
MHQPLTEQNQPETPTLMKPPSTPLFYPMRHLSALRDDMPGFMLRLREEFGGLVRIHSTLRNVYLVNEPAYVQQVLVTQGDNFTKDVLVRLIRDYMLGEGLLTNLDRSSHRRQRKLLAPAFRKKHIANYAEAMVDYSERMAEEWQAGDTFDIAHEMMRLTLGIVAKTLFDADVDNDAQEVGDALTQLLEYFPKLMSPLAPLRLGLPTPGRKKLFANLQRIDDIVLRIIREHRESPDKSGSLLSLLLQVRHEDDGSGMSDKQIRDEAITLFLAGHETTANALAWSWYLLGEHPDAWERMTREVDAVWSEDLSPYERFQKLSYTRHVFAEAIRLFPPAHIIGRKSIKTFSLGPYEIPGGSMVLLSPYAMHRDPRFWDEPDVFRPERWEDGSTDDLPKFAYYPFGGGARVCIGEHFAWMEGVLILATLARRWRPNLIPNQHIQHQALLTLRPRDGVWVKLASR